MKKKQLTTKKLELIASSSKITPLPQIRLSMSSPFKHLIVIAITAILTILTLGCPADEDGNIVLDKTQITGGSISYQDIQVNYGNEASSAAQLTGITPPDAANSDYLYSAEPLLPNGVTLNPSDGTIAITTNAPGFSNTYTITATVTGNDPQYKGSVTGSISINIEKIQITGGSISYQDIQVNYGSEASSTAQLTGITPPDAANSDYLYSAEPLLPNGVALNLTNGTITVSNNIPGGFSNTYTITATVTGNDLQYKGSVTGTVFIKVNHFSGRRSHSVVEFNNELYFIGGYDNSYYNDVWKSSDGTTWTQVTTTQSKFSGRRSHSVVEFNNELYLIGGEDSSDRLNDVWKSTDGIDWTEVTTAQSKFSKRFRHSVVEFNNELYFIGGHEGGLSYKNDVWKSIDGIDWTEVTTTQSKFSSRGDHSVVVFNNELYFIGGHEGGSSFRNDVWKSIDGIDWTQVTTTQSKFSGRYGHRVVVFNNELYLIGGEDSSDRLNDVWKSSDGIDWTEVTTAQSKFSGRYGHRVVVFNNELYFIGGYEGGSSFRNDVWKSSDGIDWEQKL